MKIAMYNQFDTMLIEEGAEKTAEFAKRLGFSGVELMSSIISNRKDAVPDVKTAGCVRRVLDDYGLPMVCYSVGFNALIPEDVQKMYQRIEIAKELGSPFVHHTLIPDMTKFGELRDVKEKIKIAVDTAEQVANYAEKLGITCIYEEQGFYVNGVENFGIFFQEMKKRCKNVGICADFGNIMCVNETPEVFLQKYMEDVKHVHIKDVLKKRNGKESRQVLVKSKRKQLDSTYYGGTWCY